MRDENAQMKAVLQQVYEAIAQTVERGPSTDTLDACMEAIDALLRRE